MALLFALVSGSAWAFPVPTYITLNPFQATAHVSNPYGHPIACMVSIQAMRSDGFVQYANVNLGYIPYGFTEYAYVYTGAPFYFVNANAWADCGYLY
ncbi:MAG: hypothetical protein NDJ89_01265 [Oligoflexia bacterium]|nr:hypothetical protein [Oligoflexia bacterium]